jgi:hypothetical protein
MDVRDDYLRIHVRVFYISCDVEEANHRVYHLVLWRFNLSLNT